MAESFTALQLMLGIVLGNLRLVCGCSVIETHFMKLPTNSYCADVASRVLQPRTDFFLCASALSDPVLLARVAYHYAAEPLLLLDVSTS
jgi:hypothetical protein